ncbi:MAG: multiheme c-type cytochrome [Anaerolineae bacterium]
MNTGQVRRMLGVVHPLLMTAVVLLFFSTSSCKGGTVVPSPTMPSELPVATPLTGGEPITATIALRGLPVEEMVDAADHLVIASGLENVAVGSYVLLEGGGAGVSDEAITGYAWTLEGPGGSTAALDDPASRTPTFIPDVTGHYTVELAVANQQGILGPVASLTIHAAIWVGAGIIDGSAASPPQCIACHADLVKTWAGTRHATSFEGAIDGEIGEYYSHCIGCHTVGYDEAAVNGGFDDVAKELGWTYPETLVEGNWESLVANYPRLANLANTQCENCHGPGSEHSGRREGIAVSLRTDGCDVCHDPLRQNRAAQWARSGHADTSFAALISGAADDERCARCHSGQGFIDDLDGKDVVGGGLQEVTCPVCHDPHDATHERQLRVFDTLALPDGTQVMDVGPSALCMTCHNGGVGPDQVRKDEPILPHGNTASEMMVGTGGYDYGQAIEDSAHTSIIGGCVGCHMAPTPGMDDVGTPDDIGDDVPLPGHDQVGEHTFRMAWDGGTPDDQADDVENVAACTGCHEGLSSFNREAAGDYDGDGETEGIQDEVQGLLDLVRAEIQVQGVQWQGEYPYWGSAATEAQRAAIYNWSFVASDGSLGIHNAGRAVRLLQLTYRHLTGRDVPGATLR